MFIPGADDLLGGVRSWQLLQLIVGQIDDPQLQEAPGHHGGQRGQAVGGEIQPSDPSRQVHEPVQLQPGQLESSPEHGHSLRTHTHAVSTISRFRLFTVMPLNLATSPSHLLFLRGGAFLHFLPEKVLAEGWMVHQGVGGEPRPLLQQEVCNVFVPWRRETQQSPSQHRQQQQQTKC